MLDAYSPPIVRTCNRCTERFEVSVEEIAFLEQLAVENAWPAVRLPNRCAPCRSAVRAERYVVRNDQPDEWRRCRDCGVDFQFGGRDLAFFAARGWLAPNRCRDCRRRGSR